MYQDEVIIIIVFIPQKICSKRATNITFSLNILFKIVFQNFNYITKNFSVCCVSWLLSILSAWPGWRCVVPHLRLWAPLDPPIVWTWQDVTSVIFRSQNIRGKYILLRTHLITAGDHTSSSSPVPSWPLVPMPQLNIENSANVPDDTLYILPHTPINSGSRFTFIGVRPLNGFPHESGE